MTKAEKKIQSFLSLGAGWHYGSGIAPSQGLAGRAIAIAKMYSALGFLKTDAFPGVDGEIMVTAYADDHCLEITLETDRTYRFSHQEGESELCYQEGLSTIAMVQLLMAAVPKVPLGSCNLYVSSTQSTTTSNLESSRIWHLGLNAIHQESLGFPVFKKTVPLNVADAFATTPQTFTAALPLIPLSFGNLMNPRFQVLQN